MKIAVITGASAGIGREFVYAVDKYDTFDEIWVIARRRERLEELAAKCRNPIRPIALDLSDLGSIDEYKALRAAASSAHLRKRSLTSSLRARGSTPLRSLPCAM